MLRRDRLTIARIVLQYQPEERMYMMYNVPAERTNVGQCYGNLLIMKKKRLNTC